MGQRPDNRYPLRSTPAPTRNRSDRPHRSPPPAPVTPAPSPGFLDGLGTTVGGTPHPCPHPLHPPPPYVRAHPPRCSYAEPSLGPPSTSVALPARAHS